MRASSPRGRGVHTNPPNRFEPRAVVPVDPDDSAADDASWEAAEIPSRAEVFLDATRTILAENDSPDVPFERSINPYRGCEHGCVYCFARPTHAYLGFSAGLDFETKILAKPSAAALLRREFAKPSYRCTPIALGTNTDPYQPLERTHRITRSILEVLAEHAHPVSIVTKSALVLRDLDILAPMAALGLAHACVSVTTLDPALARSMEPRAASPSRRIEVLRALTAAGIPSAVLASPMIPGLNDHELERILEQAAGAGARAANYILVRLPHEVKGLFEQWLAGYAPNRAGKVLGMIRAARGGRLYDARFGERMRGTGPYAELLARRFEVACRRLGLGRRDLALDTTQFRVPGRPGIARTLF